MPIRQAQATWNGTLRDGKGTFDTQSGAIAGAYSFGTRFGEEKGTNPEELIGAAHAACFSMALANELSEAGHVPDSVHTTAKVHIKPDDTGFTITQIDLATVATVAGLDEPAFQRFAVATSKACPVSKVLTGAEITLDAKLA